MGRMTPMGRMTLMGRMTPMGVIVPQGVKMNWYRTAGMIAPGLAMSKRTHGTTGASGCLS